MSEFAKSLKRLYAAGRVTLEQINGFVSTGKITAEEAAQILGD